MSEEQTPLKQIADNLKKDLKKYTKIYERGMKEVKGHISELPEAEQEEHNKTIREIQHFAKNKDKAGLLGLLEKVKGGNV